MEERTKIDFAYGECSDVIEGRRCWYCHVIRVEELEPFVGADFSKYLCSELVDCVGDGAVVGDAITEFLGIVDGFGGGLGAFVGLFIVVVAVVTVGVITSVVVTWWWG